MTWDNLNESREQYRDNAESHSVFVGVVGFVIRFFFCPWNSPGKAVPLEMSLSSFIFHQLQLPGKDHQTVSYQFFCSTNRVTSCSSVHVAWWHHVFLPLCCSLEVHSWLLVLDWLAFWLLLPDFVFTNGWIRCMKWSGRIPTFFALQSFIHLI